mgnify:CR=1 FL=1
MIIKITSKDGNNMEEYSFGNDVKEEDAKREALLLFKAKYTERKEKTVQLQL